MTKEFQLGTWQLRKYNDLKIQSFQAGDKIYLQPKRKWVKEKGITTEKKTTLWQVSQDHCVHLKKLAKINGLKMSVELEKGTFVKFRK